MERANCYRGQPGATRIHIGRRDAQPLHDAIDADVVRHVGQGGSGMEGEQDVTPTPVVWSLDVDRGTVRRDSPRCLQKTTNKASVEDTCHEVAVKMKDIVARGKIGESDDWTGRGLQEGHAADERVGIAGRRLAGWEIGRAHV